MDDWKTRITQIRPVEKPASDAATMPLTASVMPWNAPPSGLANTAVTPPHTQRENTVARRTHTHDRFHQPGTNHSLRRTCRIAPGHGGAGSINRGGLNDEDFPAVFAYSNTASKTSGHLAYGTIDAGYSFLRTPTAKLGAFAGYNYRRALAAMAPDLVLALLEDLAAVAGGLFLVSR